jgi:hypothetical protein
MIFRTSLSNGDDGMEHATGKIAHHVALTELRQSIRQPLAKNHRKIGEHLLGFKTHLAGIGKQFVCTNESLPAIFKVGI